MTAGPMGSETPWTKATNQLARIKKQASEVLTKYKIHSENMFIVMRKEVLGVWTKVRKSLEKFQIAASDVYDKVWSGKTDCDEVVHKAETKIQMLAEFGARKGMKNWYRLMSGALTHTPCKQERVVLKRHMNGERDDPISALRVPEQVEGGATASGHHYAVTPAAVLAALRKAWDTIFEKESTASWEE